MPDSTTNMTELLSQMVQFHITSHTQIELPNVHNTLNLSAFHAEGGEPGITHP